jgi:hypothetical protein
MADQWNERLRCSHCAGTGAVSLSQINGANMPTVHNISGDFKTIHTEFGPDFHCTTCDVPAAP